MYRFPSRVLRVCALAIGASLIGYLSPLPAIAGMSPAEVSAVYKITLNGFELGSFRFNSTVTADHYSADSDVELSALLGAFHWKGVTRTSGTIAAKEPRPAGFLFEFNGTAKSGSVGMGFNPAGVTSVSVMPPAADPPDTVPLGPQHLKSVLDPLSAIIALTHVDGANPCGRKVAIFDGKQRFNLELIARRPVEGQPDRGIVCRVKYVPVAGYRANEETRNLAASTGIEIAFRPVPQAKLMLPHDVVVPTLAGPAELTLEHVDIRTPDRGEIALVAD